MEQPIPREAQHNPVLIAGGNHIIIPNGAAGLGDIGNAGLLRPLHIIPEREKCIGPAGNAALLCNPRLLLLGGQDLGLDLEGLLPNALGQNVLILVGGVHVDGIVPIRAADSVHKLEAQHLGMLPDQPVVCLIACQTGAVDAAL